MRLLFHFRWLAVLTCWLGSGHAAFATHEQGGEITYASVAPTTAGVPRSHVVARLFLDYTKVQQPELILLASNSGCGGTSSGRFTVDIPQSKQLASPGDICGTAGSTARYYVGVYETDLDLPAGQWTLSVTLENRQADIVNVVNSINTDSYISAFLDNRLVTQDASPKFESVLVPRFNGMAIPAYSFSAFDADGDSLHYDFVQPQMIVGGAVRGTDCSVPLTNLQAAPHFALASNTGALLPATPSPQQGYYVTAVRVSEYRRLAGQWQLLGYVMRDLTYLAFSSTNQAPAITGLSVNGGAPQPATQPVPVRAGQTVRLTLTAADPDAGQQLRFVSDAPNVVPGLALAALGASQAQLTWQVPATLPPGRYAVPVAVFDDGCLYNASQEATLVFVVGAAQALATRAATQPAAEAYPVPFREQVQLRTQPGQAVTIVDALGRPVAQLLSGPDGRVQWQPAASLPAGLYLARTADGQLLARLLRQ